MSTSGGKENVGDFPVRAKPGGVGPRSGSRRLSSRRFTQASSPSHFPSTPTSSSSFPDRPAAWPIATNQLQPAAAACPAPEAAAATPLTRPTSNGSTGALQLLSHSTSSASSLTSASPMLRRLRKRGGSALMCAEKTQGLQQQLGSSNGSLLSAPVAVPIANSRGGKKRKGSMRADVVAHPVERRVGRHRASASKVSSSAGRAEGKMRTKPDVSHAVTRGSRKSVSPSTVRPTEAPADCGFELEDNEEDFSAVSTDVVAGGIKGEFDPPEAAGAPQVGEHPVRSRRTKEKASRSKPTPVPAATSKTGRGAGAKGAGAVQKRLPGCGTRGILRNGGDEKAALAVKSVTASIVPPIGSNGAEGCGLRATRELSNLPADVTPCRKRGASSGALWCLDTLFGNSSEDEDEEDNLDTEMLWRMSEDEEEIDNKPVRGRSSKSRRQPSGGGGGGCPKSPASHGKRVSSGGGGGKARMGAHAAGDRDIPGGPDDDTEPASVRATGRRSVRKGAGGSVDRRQEQEHVEALRALYAQVDAHKLSFCR